MEAFELDLVVRKKLVQLKGKITPKDAVYGHFLKAYQKPKATLLLCLAQKLQYQGCELQESLLFTLFIVIAETYNLITNSNSIGYQISIMISIAHALAFGCLVNAKFQILAQILLLAAAVALLVVSVNISFIELYITIGITASFFLVFVCKLLVYLQGRLYLESPTTGFSFESNLIVFIYVLWKGYEVVMVSNYSGLFAAMVVLCLINTVKVYVMFDYNILHVVSIFCEQSNRNVQESTQNAQDFSQSIALFVQTKDDSTQNQLNRQLEASPEPKDDLDNESPTVADAQPAQDMHESNKRMVVSVVMLFLFASQIIYVAINHTTSNLSSISTDFFVAACQICFILMLCQSQKTLKSYDKDLLTYIFTYLVDLVIIVLAAATSYFQSTLSLTSQTAIFYSVFPLIVVKMWNYINEQVHAQLDNGQYYLFYMFALIPLGVRSIALFQGYAIVLYLMDAIVYLYAIAILGFWSNRSQFLSVYKQIKSVLSAKKKKIKFFDKLKQLRVNYPNLVQNYVFIHNIFLSVLYSLTTFSDSDHHITYFIFYFAPLFLYFMCLINTYSFTQNRPESYSPYILNILAAIVAVVYTALGYLQTLGGDHDIYSLLVLLNVFLFCVLLQGEKMAVIYLWNYYCFMRVLLISVFFVFIYLPFISFFISGYYFTSFSQSYFYYYAMGGFFYIWLLITIAGTAIHSVLNLSEKSKKDLFIAQYMENQMKKIGLKENIEKFLMISNEYELLNHKSEDLLKYLKQEKHVMVIIRREKDVAHDYELVEPDDNLAAQRMGIVAKPINPLDLMNRIKQGVDAEDKPQEKENPVLTYFREKEKARIQIAKPVDLNNGLLELKRMAQRSRRIVSDLKDVQRSQEFRAMQAASSQQCGQLLAKFYNFLSHPSECISRETFLHLLRLLTRQELPGETADKLYQRFSQSTLINQYKFKKFLVDYVEFKYEMKQEKLCNILRTFCCYQLVPLFLAKFTQLDYHLRRKKVSLSQESRDIWLKDGGNEEDMQQFREFKVKEARKKEKLLNKLACRVQNIDQNQSDSTPSQSQDKSQQDKTMQNLARLTMRKQLKDKTFLRPQNIYAMMVSALMQCYIFYEKEAEHFKIKSIKLSVSNVLALATKMSDIFFVFGYSTVYLLIAYFQQDFTSSTSLFSSISYPVLLILAVASTLLYIALILYHKKDFQMGSLGLDDEHRSLSICSLKFFATQLLFLLGSALANYIISIALNSLICDQSTQTLYNFSSQACYTQKQYVYVFGALMILVVYWPLSAITFPFSTAMDRSLQIKYKSEFQIVYLQFKFLINGYNTLLNPYVFQTEQLIVSILKVVICFVLAILCGKMQPCSYELMNKVEGKVYIMLTILSFAGTLCYFVGMLNSILITGSLIVLYLVYFVYATVKNYKKLVEDNQQDDIIEDNIKNQQIKIKIIRENQEMIPVQGVEQAKEEVKEKKKDIVKARISQRNEEDQPSEVKLTDYPTQDLKTAGNSKQTFKFW